MKEPVVFKSEAGKQAVLSTYDGLLARWPVPYEAHFISTSLGKTHVIECGQPDAPALVLLHGSSTNAVMWMGDVAAYGRFYRILALDIPGEPGKSDPARPALTSPAYADWLAEILNQLGVNKASLVGISLGGWMAIQFASIYPDRVDKLVLLCPSGVAPQRSSFLFKAVGLMLLGGWGKSRLLRMVNGNAPMPDEALIFSKQIADHFSPRMEAVPLFTDEQLKRLCMPTLYLAGAKDVLLRSQDSAERLDSLLPNVEAHVFPDAGHVIIGVSERVIQFLRSGKEITEN